MKIGEKRSPVWDSFYKIPEQEDSQRKRKRIKMVQEIGHLVGDNVELILPKEVWLLVREFYGLLLCQEYMGIKSCRDLGECKTQYRRTWNQHRQHNILCRDDYKMWYYSFYKEPLKKDWFCKEYTMKPLEEKKSPTIQVLRHINFGRVLFMLKNI